MRLIPLILVMATIMSCDGPSSFNTVEVGKDKDLDLEKPESSPPAQPVVVVDPTPAVPPVAIGGASLSCIARTPAVSLLCSVQENGAPAPIQAQSIYIITGMVPVWTKAAFEAAPAEPSAYIVTPPALTPSSFVVALEYGDHNYLFSNVGTAPKLSSILADGTFAKLLDPLLITPTTTSDAHYFAESRLNEGSTPWKVALNATSNCSDHKEAFLQLHKMTNGLTFVDLDSDCVFSAGNTTLTQALTPAVGHVYSIGFRIKANRDDTEKANPKAQRLQVSWGDTAIYDAYTVNSDWEWRWVDVLANTAAAKIDFAELGIANKYGTHITDISVYDLGTPP